MKEMKLRDIQLTELSILEHLDKECKRMHLRYGLTSGTVLGAIRHGGFIPWDDDIDIVMPRPDYERLIRDYDDNHGRYILESPYTDDDYLYEYIKIMDAKTVLIEDPDRNAIKTHVYIDVFPVDGVPSDKQLRLKHFKRVERAKKLYVIRARLKMKAVKSEGLRKGLLTLANAVICLLPRTVFCRNLDRISKKYPFESSEYAAVVTGQGEKEVLKTSDYQLDGVVEFEGEQFSTYSDPHGYLTQFFGDYMSLPPVEQRKGHNFIAWRI